MFCLRVCLYTICVRCPWGPDEGIRSPELELQIVVNRHGGVVNGTERLRKNSKDSQPLSGFLAAAAFTVTVRIELEALGGEELGTVAADRSFGHLSYITG